jgi:hypothetical protein
LGIFEDAAVSPAQVRFPQYVNPYLYETEQERESAFALYDQQYAEAKEAAFRLFGKDWPVKAKLANMMPQ